MNSLALNSTNCFFSNLMDHGKKECKRYGLELAMLQRTRDELNEDRMNRLDFINESLRQKNEPRAYINNIDKAMLEYFQIFAKQIKSIPAQPGLFGFLPYIRWSEK